MYILLYEKNTRKLLYSAEMSTCFSSLSKSSSLCASCFIQWSIKTVIDLVLTAHPHCLLINYLTTHPFNSSGLLSELSSASVLRVWLQVRFVLTSIRRAFKLVYSWIPWNLYWSIHTKDESKRDSAFAFIFGVNWRGRCGIKALVTRPNRIW